MKHHADEVRLGAPPGPEGLPKPRPMVKRTVAPSAIAEALDLAARLRRRGVTLRVVDGRVLADGSLRAVDRAGLQRHAPVLAALLAPGRPWPAAVAETLLTASLDRTADRYATALVVAGIWPGSVNDLPAEEVRVWAARRDALDSSLVEAREAGDLVAWAAAVEAFESWARARIAALRA